IFGRFNFIQTWHGTPLKKIGIDAQGQNSSLPFSSKQDSVIYKSLKKLHFFSRQKFKLITAPSKITNKILKRTLKNSNILMTDYPRNDILYNPKLSIKNYKKELNLDIYKRIILYAPTFRDNHAEAKPFPHHLEHYNRVLKEKKYLFLVKKHPWQKNLIIQEHLSHIKDVSDQVEDIQELLCHTDILVTDFSSCFFDFMLTEKPVVFYPYDFENYIKHCRGLYLNYFNDLPGPFAKTEKELFELIFSVEKLENQNAYKSNYNSLVNQYNTFQDGRSSQRILENLFPSLEF